MLSLYFIALCKYSRSNPKLIGIESWGSTKECIALFLIEIVIEIKKITDDKKLHSSRYDKEIISKGKKNLGF